MARIEIFTDPSGIRKFTTHKLEKDTNLLDFLIQQFGANGFNVPYRLYKGCVHSENEILLEKFTDNGIEVKESDVFILILNPLGIETLITTFVISAIVGFGASYLASQLLPKPTMPNSERVQANESPNNSLTAQTNTIRPLERIPDLYGTNRVYPDLLQTAVTSFANGFKTVSQFFCVGVGEYSMNNFKEDDSLLENFGAKNYLLNIIEPNTTMNDVFFPKNYNVSNGIELIKRKDWSYSDNDINFFLAYGNWAIDRTTPFNQLTNGDIVSIRGSLNNDGIHYFAGSSDRTYFKDVLQSETGSGTRTVNFYNKIFVDTTMDFNGNGENNTIKWVNSAFKELLKGDQIVITSSTLPSYNGTYTIDWIDYDHYVFHTVSYAGFGIRACTIEQIKSGGSVNMSIGEDYCDKILINFETEAGINESVEVEVNIYYPNSSETLTMNKTVPAYQNKNNFESVTFNLLESLGGNLSQASFYTGRNNYYPDQRGCVVSAKITSNTSTKIRINDIYGFGRADKQYTGFNTNNFGNVTMIYYELYAQFLQSGTKSGKFNCMATRKLRTYDVLSEAIIETKSATNQFSDAVLEVLTSSKGGNRDVSTIDLSGLYEIQNELNLINHELGEFNYCFSNKNTTIAEEIQTICNACRVFAYREGDIFRFGIDKKRIFARTLFNSRNKKPNSETKIILFAKPNEDNGIEFQWVEKNSGDGRTIFYPENATNYKKVESAGIKNYSQAYNRALFEYQKLKLKRVQVKTTVTKDGLIVSVGDRVSNADGTSVKSLDGEILEVAGLVVRTNRKIAWGTVTEGTVIIRGEDGEVGEIPCTPSIDEFSLTLQYLPSFDIIIGGREYQIGSLFCLKIADNIYSDYTIDKISPSDDNYVELEMSNYTDDLYLYDEEIPN